MSHKFYHNQWIQTGDDKIPPIGIGGRYLPTDPIEPDRPRAKASWKVEI
jgi:hypothetical protein